MKKVLAFVALALAAGVSPRAMAFEQSGGFHSDRFAGVRGYSALRRGDFSGQRGAGYSPGPRGYVYGPSHDGRYGYHGLFPRAY